MIDCLSLVASTYGHDFFNPYSREEQISMNKSTGLKNNAARIFLAVTVAMLAWTSGAAAQETLADAVQQTGCNWLMGKWAGETPEGQKYAIEYKWALKDHVISVHFKGFDFEYHGIIFYKPIEQEVVQIGADSNGGHGEATWFAEYGVATMRSEHKGDYGEVSRMGFVYKKTDGNAMKLDVYGMDEYGRLSDQPGSTLEFKRVKKK
jgi:hypothetical protein